MGDVVGDKTPFIYDFGAAYELDKFEYYPRDSYGSGTVERMNVYSGFRWKTLETGMGWNKEESGYITQIWK